MREARRVAWKFAGFDPSKLCQLADEEIWCPVCGGDGYYDVQKPGGWNEPIYEQQGCGYCQGTGRVRLGDALERVFEADPVRSRRWGGVIEFADGEEGNPGDVLDHISSLAERIPEPKARAYGMVLANALDWGWWRDWEDGPPFNMEDWLHKELGLSRREAEWAAWLGYRLGKRLARKRLRTPPEPVGSAWEEPVALEPEPDLPF